MRPLTVSLNFSDIVVAMTVPIWAIFSSTAVPTASEINFFRSSLLCSVVVLCACIIGYSLFQAFELLGSIIGAAAAAAAAPISFPVDGGVEVGPEDVVLWAATASFIFSHLASFDA